MRMNTLLTGALTLLLAPLAFAQGSNLLPPDAAPGKCYVQKFYPPVYRQESLQVPIRDGHKTFKVTPAVFETVPLSVTVRDAFDDIVLNPPQFDTVDITVETAPGHNVWTYGCCDQPPPRHTHSGPWPWSKPCCDEPAPKPQACGNACLKAVPPESKTFKKTRLVRDGTTQVAPQAAEVQTVMVRKLRTPPRREEVVVPPEFLTVTIKRLVSAGELKWEEGYCKKYTCDPRELQSALKDRGFFAGPVNGQPDETLTKAMNAFRAANGLGIHDDVDEATTKALGIGGTYQQ